MIDFTKPVRTKDGYPVRIVCTDFQDDKVIGIMTVNGDENLICYYADGVVYWPATRTSQPVFNLENIPETIKNYYNLFSNGSLGFARSHIEDCINYSKQMCARPMFILLIETEGTEVRTEIVHRY